MGLWIYKRLTSDNKKWSANTSAISYVSVRNVYIYAIFVKAILVFDNNQSIFIIFENANKQSKKVIKELNNCSVCLFIYFLIYFLFKTQENG